MSTGSKCSYDVKTADVERADLACGGEVALYTTTPVSRSHSITCLEGAMLKGNYMREFKG